MLPKGWKNEHLRRLISSLEAGVSVNGEDRQAMSGEKGVLRVSAVSNGTFLPQENKAIVKDAIALAKTSPKADRIIFSRSNTEALVGASAYVTEDHPDLYLSDKLWQLEPNAEISTSMRWLAYWLASDHIRNQLSKLGTGTSGSMKNISKEELFALRISIPPHKEQRAIADVLATWDSAIAATEKLLANSREQKRALANALLSGRRRLSSEKNWSIRKLSDLIVESRIPGSSGDVAKKITVKLYGRGVVAKNEKRLGSDSTQYYRRAAGQFIYSKLDFLNGAFGLIPNELDGFESTLDLPAFDFKPGIDPLWFLHFVSREDFYLGHLGLANGGRKARRVNPPDLLKVSVLVPSLKEQQAIAKTIGLAIADEEGWERNLMLLQQQKRALMQQLLTGKRRVRIPASESTP